MRTTIDSKQYVGIKIIAGINGIASLLHVMFWIFVFTQLPGLSSQANISDKLNLGTVYGLGMADLFVSVPILFIGSTLLWKKKVIGWLCAHLANVLYWYSFIVIITRDVSRDSFAPGTILFFPFALFSLWAAYYLWRVRGLFLNK